MPREAARKVITDAMVRKLKPAPKGKRVEYWDAVIPGFGLRVTDAGGKSFFLRARRGTEQLRMSWPYPVTSLEAARGAAKAALEDIDRGVNPKARQETERREREERESNTFKVVCDRFMRQHVNARLAPITQREYRLVLFGADTARWADMPVSSISRADVRAVIDSIMERGSPSMANNTLAYLRKFFNWCAEKDLIELPPTERLKAPAAKAVRERSLSESEVAEVWRAFDPEGTPFGDIFRLLLLTGQRRSEVGEMVRSELHGLEGDSPTWEIPGARTKNGRPHIVPLAPKAAEIVRNRCALSEEELLFTTTGTTPISGYSKAKARVDARIAATREEAGESPMPEWTLHDLRRTMVTLMNERLGIAPHVVEACVNHVSGSAKAGVAGVYNKAIYFIERKDSMHIWCDFIGRHLEKAVLKYP